MLIISIYIMGLVTANVFEQIQLSNYSGIAYLSNNTIYEDSSSTYDIHDTFVIYMELHNSSNINKSHLMFEWKRSENIKLVGTISKFNFNAYYKQKYIQSNNENKYIDYKDKTYLYEYCYNPIPSSYNFQINAEWIESSLASNTKQKIPGSNCRDSDAAFWSDPYQNMCDSSTSYLNNLHPKNYVKFFECNSIIKGQMNEYKWYHNPDQLSKFATLANRVKIVVYDNINGTIHTVISNTNSYVVSNLLFNRALSHPYDYINGNKSTYFVNVSKQWT
eukprot:102244_1